MKLITATPWGVYSVWWRHFQVYRSTWLVSCLPPISEPIVYLLAFGYGLSPLIGDVEYLGQVIPYAQFLAPGMIAIGVLFQSFFEGAYSSFIRLNFQKTWQALLTAPLSYTDVFLGDWFWAATKGTIAGTLTGLVAVLANLYDLSSLVLSLPLIVLGSLLFGAFGLLVTGSVSKVDQVNVPIFLVVIPMFTLCGTYFPRNTLPPLLAKFASLLPLASLVDLLRWPLGLPPWWPLLLLWLVGWMVVMARLAALRIYPRLFS
ncbi:MULTISPECIES: ABC transporter permease [Cyanophyceae]|uniref:ABC transporter permease n=1 Tax=Cyanophyceae TaxID=3028117 RepID=UPI001688C4D9|nr:MULTISPECIES: ABC transporter permease [Cyanophyceae]MBD1918746.1 ABC transporter permease [Phormidium sp. FACHB-77]MBD2033399.1 ABC transporter permease [Phormidium sp. FACHB-322]MBD2053898.1 ABC transporter permease [Leptolyngbya sp. FACHB-60]